MIDIPPTPVPDSLDQSARAVVRRQNKQPLVWAVVAVLLLIINLVLLSGPGTTWSVALLGLSGCALAISMALATMGPWLSRSRAEHARPVPNGVGIAPISQVRRLWQANTVVAAIGFLLGTVALILAARTSAAALTVLAACLALIHGMRLRVGMTQGHLAARALILTPDEVLIFPPSSGGQPVSMPWDGLVLTPVADDHGSMPIQGVQFQPPGAPAQFQPTDLTVLSLWEVLVVLEHFRDHRDQRRLLATPEGSPLVEQLRGYEPGASIWSPHWLKPPPADWSPSAAPIASTTSTSAPTSAVENSITDAADALPAGLQRRTLIALVSLATSGLFIAHSIVGAWQTPDPMAPSNEAVALTLGQWLLLPALAIWVAATATNALSLILGRSSVSPRRSRDSVVIGMHPRIRRATERATTLFLLDLLLGVGALVAGVIAHHAAVAQLQQVAGCTTLNARAGILLAIFGGGLAYLNLLGILAGRRRHPWKFASVDLSTDGVAVSQGSPRSTPVRLPWDGIATIAGGTPRTRHLAVLEIRSPSHSSVAVPTMPLAISRAQLAAVIDHFRDHPQERAQLGHAEGLEIVERVRMSHSRE